MARGCNEYNSFNLTQRFDLTILSHYNFPSRSISSRTINMPSSIFKSICAAAAFLAFPTAAQIDNWDISYQSMETNFTQNVNDEITLDYRISTGRAFNIDLFDKGCNDPITGMPITTTPVRTAGLTDDHDQLKIMLDLDKTDITSSNIWSNTMLDFCVRVQLLSNGKVIKEE